MLHFILSYCNICYTYTLHQKSKLVKNYCMRMETGATQTIFMLQGTKDLWLKYAVNHHQSWGNSKELHYRMVL